MVLNHVAYVSLVLLYACLTYGELRLPFRWVLAKTACSICIANCPALGGQRPITTACPENIWPRAFVRHWELACAPSEVVLIWFLQNVCKICRQVVMPELKAVTQIRTCCFYRPLCHRRACAMHWH